MLVVVIEPIAPTFAVLAAVVGIGLWVATRLNK